MPKRYWARGHRVYRLMDCGELLTGTILINPQGTWSECCWRPTKKWARRTAARLEEKHAV